MAKKLIFLLITFLLAALLFLFVEKPPAAEHIQWGVNFSAKHATNLGLDWKEAYEVIFKDLGAKHVKVAVHWDSIEPEQNVFFFEDVDWQMQKAERNNAKVVLAIGMKTPRWPECHIPVWAKDLSKERQQEAILRMLQEVVARYKDSSALFSWQVENEPFFPFGECPWQDSSFLKKELILVQSIDSSHPSFTSDSGELSLWIRAAILGDKVSVTMYRKAWFEQLGRYVTYPFPTGFYWHKAQLIQFLFAKDVVVGELQAEPWGPRLLQDVSLQEQQKTMNLQQFQKNIAFVKSTGLSEFYLWGAEWWYWMKEKHEDAGIWNEAKKLFRTTQ